MKIIPIYTTKIHFNWIAARHVFYILYDNQTFLSVSYFCDDAWMCGT